VVAATRPVLVSGLHCVGRYKTVAAIIKGPVLLSFKLIRNVMVTFQNTSETDSITTQQFTLSTDWSNQIKSCITCYATPDSRRPPATFAPIT
jgi:hypothetical protein